jgi:hypothetical protein
MVDVPDPTAISGAVFKIRSRAMANAMVSYSFAGIGC